MPNELAFIIERCWLFVGENKQKGLKMGEKSCPASATELNQLYNTNYIKSIEIIKNFINSLKKR
jgi:hypothetical protein